jgi:hypothetical protein
MRCNDEWPNPLSPDLNEMVIVSGGGVRRDRYVLGSAAG